MNVPLTAIVPAAGTGVRAAGGGGVPKQYRLLGGTPMLRRAVEALLADPRVAEIRVAVAPGDQWAASALADLPRTVWRPCGGPTRADTVRQALADAALADDAWVMVHDAARPGLPLAALSRLIEMCLAHDRGGLLARPVADTLKRVRADPRLLTADPAAAAKGAPMRNADAWPVRAGDRDPVSSDCPARDEKAAGNGRGEDALPVVDATVSRDGLWLAQTPQMFRAGVLRAALAASAGDAGVTDEAAAVERHASPGQAPLLVQGARINDKLTWPADFEWFESWLRARSPDGSR